MRRAHVVFGLVMAAAVVEATSCSFQRLPPLGGDGDGGAGGSSPACTAQADCKTSALPVCDTTKDGGHCVACTQADHGACGGTTPRCEGDRCAACIDDGDCPSSVCLLNGACVDPATVVHAVATGGSSTTGCGQPPPAGGGACTLEQALTNARGKGLTVIKLDDAATYAPLACGADAGFVAANNIIWNNNSASPATSIQLSGSCKQRYSDIGPTSFPNAIDAGNNKNTNPLFVNATSDLHLTAQSPLGDLAADPAADLAGIASLDLDGDPRAAPAAMGADQPLVK